MLTDNQKDNFETLLKAFGYNGDKGIDFNPHDFKTWAGEKLLALEWMYDNAEEYKDRIADDAIWEKIDFSRMKRDPFYQPLATL